MTDKLVIFFALVAPTALRAQPSSPYEFHAVVQPGTTIDGHTFTRDTTIDGAAINDAGEIVFIATDPGVFMGTSVFTSRRSVAGRGDVIDGKIILLVVSEPLLVINAAGQIAYTAWYAENASEMSVSEPAGLGIFVDRHFILRAALTGSPDPLPDFSLAEDGHIITKTKAISIPKNTSPVGRIHLPKGLPISISAKGSAAKQSIAPQFPTNRSGQILIPVNFDNGGFLLLLGTPKPK